MKSFIEKLWLIVIFLIVLPSLCFAKIELNPEGYFETHGFAFLVYHNDYLVGKRGGLQMFLHDKRVADAAEVFCLTSDGSPLIFDSKENGERTVDLEKGLSSSLRK